MKKFCVAVIVLAFAVALAVGATTLTFDRPPAQGPGTPGFQIVSDPTIPTFGPGRTAWLAMVASIDLQGNGAF